MLNIERDRETDKEEGGRQILKKVVREPKKRGEFLKNERYLSRPTNDGMGGGKLHLRSDRYIDRLID